MLTVPEAARRTRRHPETIRRWIREGKLPARKVGTQHVIEEQDLTAFLASADRLPTLPQWTRMMDGRPMPDVVAIIRRQRAEH